MAVLRLCSYVRSRCSLAVRFIINIYLLTKGSDNVTSIIERSADAGFMVPKVIALLVKISAVVRSQPSACQHLKSGAIVDPLNIFFFSRLILLHLQSLQTWDFI